MFVKEYNAAEALRRNVPDPENYSFSKKGSLVVPFLMQARTACMAMECVCPSCSAGEANCSGEHKYRPGVGNWSTPGSGKTLAAVLTSRHMNAKTTIVVCPKSVATTVWGSKRNGDLGVIEQAYPYANVRIVKDTRDLGEATKGWKPGADASAPRFIVVRTGLLQQREKTAKEIFMDEQRKSTTASFQTNGKRRKKDLENAWDVMTAEDKKRYEAKAKKSKRSSSVRQLQRLVKGCDNNGYPVEMVILDEIQQVKVRSATLQRRGTADSKKVYEDDSAEKQDEKWKKNVTNRVEAARVLLKCCRDLAEKKKRRCFVLGLSGTPVVNNLNEAKSLIELVTGKKTNLPSSVFRNDYSPLNCLRVHREP